MASYDLLRKHARNVGVINPIQGTAIVVLHPGSLNLRLGRASDSFPHVIPQCIARRLTNPSTDKGTHQSWLRRPECNPMAAAQHRLHAVNQAKEYLRYRPTKTQGYRQDTSHTDLAAQNRHCRRIKTDVITPRNWTNVDNEQEYFVGEEAMYIKPTESYHLSWPMCCGQLNVQPNIVGGSVTAVIQDLEDIWSYAIQECLEIPVKDLKHYRAVLLIPDIYDQGHVKVMLNILLNQLGFSAAFVHQESVCATFGAGVASACVVDVGDQKTSVSCVDDGISQSKTRITQDYGGRDITQCLHWLLRRIGLPEPACNISTVVDAMFVQQVKESLCHMDQETFGIHQEFLQLQRPQEVIVKYQLNIGDEMIIAPMGTFCPDMFGLVGAEKQLYRTGHRSICQSDDIHDDDYIVQTRVRHEEQPRKKKDAQNTDPSAMSSEAVGLDESTLDVDDDPADCLDIVDGATMTAGKSIGPPSDEDDEFDLSEGLLGVDQAILQSIDKCESDEMKRRMYSNIVVVGGGLSKFRGTPGWVKYSVWTQMPKQHRFGLETMDVLTQPKEMDPTMVSWKGGAILSCLDTAQELWIRQKDWNRWGARMLRERAPFIW